MIELPESEAPVWSAALDLADLFPEGWTLIGARMVELHGLERGAVPPRVSLDLDVLLPVRVLPDSSRRFSAVLCDAGYEFDGASPAGIGHRFKRGGVSVDLLAPDGLGSRADLRTVAGARTLEVPGGTQALRRSKQTRVRLGPRKGALPRPDLLGAILVKARAVEVDDLPDAQRRDVAFLLSLVPDPWAMREDLRGQEQRWLARRKELTDPGHPAWSGIQAAADGRIALEVLSEP